MRIARWRAASTGRWPQLRELIAAFTPGREFAPSSNGPHAATAGRRADDPRPKVSKPTPRRSPGDRPPANQPAAALLRDYGRYGHRHGHQCPIPTMRICTKHLREITGLPLSKAIDMIMIEATSDTGAFINSSALKRLAVKALEDMQRPASALVDPALRRNESTSRRASPARRSCPERSIVIPEVVQSGRLPRHRQRRRSRSPPNPDSSSSTSWEPIIVHSLFENIEMLVNAMNTLREKCVVGITANPEVCRQMVYNSIGLVTALNPYLGYETSTMLAKGPNHGKASTTFWCSEHRLMSEEEAQGPAPPRTWCIPAKKITPSDPPADGKTTTATRKGRRSSHPYHHRERSRTLFQPQPHHDGMMIRIFDLRHAVGNRIETVGAHSRCAAY